MSIIRSFIAIPLNAGIIARIEKTQRDLKSLSTDVKWVNPNSIHLTLKFLGNIEEDDIEKIAQAVQDGLAEYTPWSAQVKNLGAFPSFRSPRVVWAGIEDPGGRLIKLQSQIEEEMATRGFGKEARKFSPHLTLGRVRSSKGKNELLQYLIDEREQTFGEIRIDRVILFKSELKPTGAVYTALKEFTFF